MKSTMNLALEDLALLKQLKAAGERGRTIRAYNMRLALDRLAKGGYVAARPIGLNCSTIGSQGVDKWLCQNTTDLTSGAFPSSQNREVR
jgi:hypothetical protein